MAISEQWQYTEHVAWFGLSNSDSVGIDDSDWCFGNPEWKLCSELSEDLFVTTKTTDLWNGPEIVPTPLLTYCIVPIAEVSC